MAAGPGVVKRRKGPTPKRGSRRARVEQLGAGVYVQDLSPDLLEAFLAAGEDGLGDDCPLCRAAGIRVREDGQVEDVEGHAGLA